MQVLTGDSADNIPGLYRVGPKKAGGILSSCKTEKDLYKATLEAYEGNRKLLDMNAQLLWLRREKDQLWTPPK